MAQSYEEHVVETLDECLALVKKGRNAWINVDGLQNIGIISRLGDYYKLHPLIQEDIIQTDSRPKLEEEDNYLFITFQMLTYNEVLMEVVHEQVSIAILKNVVLSFQERQGDVFDGVRDRIRTSKGLVRERGSDYLAYSLIDAVVDNIFSV
jgi:magnesium transporter